MPKYELDPGREIPPLVAEEMGRRGEGRGDVRGMAEDGEAVTVWTVGRVYFAAVDVNGTAVIRSVPRNPNGEATLLVVNWN